MVTKTADQIWQTALGELELQVASDYFKTWLRPTVGLDIIQEELIVGAPSIFHVEHLEKRMLSQIKSTLRGIAKRPLSVRFQVYQKVAQEEGLPTFSYPQAETALNNAGSSTPAVRAPACKNGANLNPRYTFDTFIVGNCNRLAHDAALAVAESPGTAYNPLYLYSSAGLGKTHLLFAIGNACVKKSLKVLYVSTEQFTNDFITAIRERKTEGFREKYRSVDVLLMDDIQFLMGKEETEKGFFHTFNDLYNDNHQILVASDRAPKALTLVEERLRSRFEGGLKADIQPPDRETRLSIIEARARQMSIPLNSGVSELLARRAYRNIRELEGALNKVVAYARMIRSPVTLELVSEALTDSLEEHHASLSLQQVVSVVADYYHLDAEMLKGKRRDKETALARHVTMYLLRQETDLSLHSIGQQLGGRDHSTVLHACTHISRLLDKDSQLKYDTQALRDLLHLPVLA